MNLKVHVPLPERGVLAMSGDDTRELLQNLITNDIRNVSPTNAIYAALLTPQGKFLHDFFIAEYKGGLLLDCKRERMTDLIKRLKIYRMRSQVEIADESDKWSVSGTLPNGNPDSAAQLQFPGTAKAFFDGISYVDPRHSGLGERTIRLIGDVEPMPAGEDQHADNRAEYELLRVSLGIPNTGTELIADKSMPLESGLDELRGVDFEKGCYVGQEVTTRMKHRNLVKKRLFPVVLNGEVSTGALIKAGDIVAGELLSVTRRRGIALLRLDLAENGELTADGVAVFPDKPDWANF